MRRFPRAPFRASTVRSASVICGCCSGIKLAAVAMQMGLAHVVIGADHAALEDREKILGGVAVAGAVETDELLDRVVHGNVQREVHPGHFEGRALIGHEGAFAVNVGPDQAAELRASDVGDVERASAPVTFDKRDNSLLGGRAAMGAIAGLAAHERLIGLDNRAGTAERIGAAVHGFADTMGENHALL